MKQVVTEESGDERAGRGMEEEDVDEKRIEQDRQITGGNVEGVKVEKLREHYAENEKGVNKEKEEQVNVKEEETEEWVEEPGKRPDQSDPPKLSLCHLCRTQNLLKLCITAQKTKLPESSQTERKGLSLPKPTAGTFIPHRRAVTRRLF